MGHEKECKIFWQKKWLFLKKRTNKRFIRKRWKKMQNCLSVHVRYILTRPASNSTDRTCVAGTSAFSNNAISTKAVSPVEWSLKRCNKKYNITLLPSVNTLTARGMFCGAKYTHHTFTPVIKHLITTTANKHPGKKSFIYKNVRKSHWHQAVRIT